MPTLKRNTLLKTGEGNAATKAVKRIFFSPPKNPPPGAELQSRLFAKARGIQCRQ